MLAHNFIVVSLPFEEMSGYNGPSLSPHGPGCSSADGNPPIVQPQTAFKGHDLIGLDFSSTTGMLKVGGLHAIDWFDDSSLYLLKVPSHTLEHIMVLVHQGSSCFLQATLWTT